MELKDRYDPNKIFRFNRNIPPTSARNKELEDNLKTEGCGLIPV